MSTVETGIHFSSVPLAIESEYLPTDVSYDTELQSGQNPGEDNKHTVHSEIIQTPRLFPHFVTLQTYSKMD
jgi:hypothetical protein